MNDFAELVARLEDLNHYAARVASDIKALETIPATWICGWCVKVIAELKFSECALPHIRRHALYCSKSPEGMLFQALKGLVEQIDGPEPIITGSNDALVAARKAIESAEGEYASHI